MLVFLIARKREREISQDGGFVWFVIFSLSEPSSFAKIAATSIEAFLEIKIVLNVLG